MAFCIKCGKQIDDGAPFCVNCGAPQAQAPRAPQGNYGAPAPAAPVYPVSPQPAKKAPWKIILPIAAVAAAAAVALVLILTLGVGGYKKALDLLCDISEGDFSDVEDLYPAAVWETYADAADEDVDDVIEEVQEQAEKSFKKSKKTDAAVSYEIMKETELDEDDLKDLAKGLHKAYKNIDTDDVTEAVWLKVKLIAEVDGDETTSTRYIGAVKIDSGWYLLNAGSDKTVYPVFLLNALAGI